MKTKLTLVITGIVAVVLLSISGCSTTGSAVKCPDLASHKSHTPSFAKATKSVHHNKSETTAAASASNTAKPAAGQSPVEAKKMKPNLLAAAFKDDVPFKLRIPKYAEKYLNQEQEDEMNAVMRKYSNNKVGFEKNAKGKLFLKADSRKDFSSLIKALKEAKASAPIDEHLADIFALVGFICGIVAIASFAIPYWDFVSIFPTGPAGVVFGVLGLSSGDRHKKALIGIILGGIGFTLGIVFFILWTFVFFPVLL